MKRNYNLLHLVAAGMAAIVMVNASLWAGFAMALIGFSIAEIIALTFWE